MNTKHLSIHAAMATELDHVEAYALRVRELEEQGLCTSDAQGVADAEEMQGTLRAKKVTP